MATRSDTAGGRKPRRGRRLRRLGVVLGTIFALIGIWNSWTFWFGDLGAGHFRSAAGRAAYVEAYAKTFEALPDPTSTSDVHTTQGTVRVYQWSSPETAGRTPVALIPGRASGVPMWAANLSELVEERPVIAFDPLGDAGLSVQGVPFESFRDQATYIHDVLSQVAPGGAHVVGHSFGARLATAHALSHPDQVRSLTLLEPVFTLAPPSARMLGWAALATLPGVPGPIRTQALTKVGGEPYDPDDPMAQMIEAGTEHYKVALPQPSVPPDQELSTLRIPTYIAIADRDSLAGGEEAMDAAQKLPDATAEMWPDTTHSLPMQGGAELNRRVLTHMAEHD